METLQAIDTRRSIRSYSDREISDSHIQTILKAAMMAPSAGNQQPWQFIVVRDQEKLKAMPEFHPFGKMIAKAQVAIVVCGDPDGKKWPDFWMQDCSAAVQNILLAATDLGIGSVWTGIYPIEERMQGARKLLNIPENVFPFAIIPLGWPEGDFKTMDRFNQDLIHNETW